MNYKSFKNSLRTKGATNFRNVVSTITTIDETLVTVTRFEFTDKKGNKKFGACEPETGFYETSSHTIGKIS